ncbi:hypothetical protein [Streptomyces avicenniae]|uniref:hypothetical protein n=1 Tax=Streptomyces avicenniae TaxID=500153 RepID=UPI0006996CFB|nr:hypothetical protein [Streptomyces avicenniae]
MAALITNGPLTPTHHPLQRAGAWAVAVLAGRATPDEVSGGDLDTVATLLVDEVCAAAVAPKDSPAYDWWKVLFALYPNSKATHARRPREVEALRPSIAAMFAPDLATDLARPCTFCGADTTVLWAKSTLPLFDTNRALNTLPPGVLGWPVCRGCRVAAWALPYGSQVTAGSATVVTCDADAAERTFAERNVRRARRIMHVGFTGLGAVAPPELVVARALRDLDAALCATTLWSFKNDNQEPWLRATRTRRAVPRFLRRVKGNAQLRRGWSLFEQCSTRRDRGGQVTISGAAAVARLLFEPEAGRHEPFLYRLHTLMADPDRPWSARDRFAVIRLAQTYAEEILGMSYDLGPIAELLTRWIAHGDASPRGRFAEYRQVALKQGALGRLLVHAQSRLMFDGQEVKVDPKYWARLLERRPQAWEMRMLLFADVAFRLQEEKVPIGQKPKDLDEQLQVEQQVNTPILPSEDVLDNDGYDESGI